MYVLLQRQNLVPRTPIAFSPELLVPGFWAIDLETKGLDAADPESRIVGIGLANAKHCFYIDLTQDVPAGLLDFLRSSTFTAFNVMFDGTHLQVYTGAWLRWVGCSYGLFKQLSSESWPGQSWSLEVAQLDVLGWPTTNKTALEVALKERRLGKGDMWQLPAEILGPYCASDADAAWQLWEVLVQAAKPFPHLMDYHQRLFLTEVRLLAEQQIRGIKIDQQRLEACRANNEAQIAQSMNAFLTIPEVAHHIAEVNKDARAAWEATQPPRLTKTGEESARWRAWKDREATWMEQRGFNLNSKQQLEKLFYDKLGFKPSRFTETGRRVVDRKVLPSLGEPGRLLADYNIYLKRRGYIAATIEKAARDGCIHPQFNSAGAVTTRLGGSGGWNAQQMPKSVDFLYSLSARPGHKLVQADAEALEPTILAEFSRDKTLWSLYGPDAKPNDVYLFVCSKMPALGKEILKYYDPENPTAESIKKTKKVCKNDRAVGKKFHLMSTYKAGPKRIREDMELDGIHISLSEAIQMHREYWAIWPGVLRFEETLKNIWRNSGGWIPSALGTPICVAEQFLKDINNKFCQTSGHKILQLWIYYTNRLRNERQIEMFPWILDNHDEMFWEAPDSHAEAAAQAITDALALANQELNMEVKIKGPTLIVENMAQVKCDNYADWIATTS